MKTLENQVRDAFRARAMEITPDRIRPLELTGSAPGDVSRLPGAVTAGAQDPAGAGRAAGGWPARRGRGLAALRGRRTRRGRRLAAPVAAAAAVAVLTAVLAGVIGGGHDRSSPRARGTSPASGGHGRGSAPTAADRRLATEVLGLYLPATGPQYAAGARLEGTFQALKLVVTARCLARAGVQVQRLPVASLAARYAANYPDNSQFPDLPRISRMHVFVSPTFAVRLRPGPGQQQAYKRSIGPCQAAATAMFAPLDSAGQRLGGNTWDSLIGSVQVSRPARATLGRLRRCAARYGWPANPYGPPETSIRTFSDFADWVFGHLDGAGTRGATQAAMRQLGRHWTAVFVRCGTATLAAQDRWLAGRQAEFVRQHARQVRALESLAQRIIRRAGGGS